jgi:hypothetical protein
MPSLCGEFCDRARDSHLDMFAAHLYNTWRKFAVKEVEKECI